MKLGRACHVLCLLMLTLASFSIVQPGASADPRKLTGPEIRQLFVDKTAHGMWGSSEY